MNSDVIIRTNCEMRNKRVIYTIYCHKPINGLIMNNALNVSVRKLLFKGTSVKETEYMDDYCTRYDFRLINTNNFHQHLVVGHYWI